MIHSANETLGQARQGSVAAMIQVLNEHLAEAGIRTRAVVANGILQILCEAATPEQLNQQVVVERVRQALEVISPQRIRKVKINSRIVKEQQLLWLEEISRDPENSLLWAEIITLKRPFFVKRWIRDHQLKPADPMLADLNKSTPQGGLPKVAAGIALLLLVLAAGWIWREDLSQSQQIVETIPASEGNTAPEGDQRPALVTEEDGSAAAPSPAGDRTADTTPPTSWPAAEQLAPSATVLESVSPDSSTGPVDDAFAEAVRLAQQAAIDGKTATATAEWLALAAHWQRAADLMSDIPTGAQQHAIAQDRIETYQANSRAALQKAAAASAAQE